MSALVRAYHFVGDRLRDGRPVPADGVWLEYDGPIAICASGLHASRRPWHALAYAPGPVLCLVEVEGIEAEQDDKLVARRRRIVRRVDLTDDLRAFARQCALDVIHLWEAPDVVLRYLETGDESLRAAARDAAWAAARDAATDDAAWAAAWTAVRAAARGDAAWDAAAWDVARAAAWDAAAATVRDAVRDAARAASAAASAAWDAVRDAAWDAAWAAAAWDAARDAARAAQGERFDALCAARLEVEL